MGASFAILCPECITIVVKIDFLTSFVNYWLNSKGHSLLKLHPLALLAKIWNMRFFVHFGSDAMPSQFFNDTQSISLNDFRNRKTNITDVVSRTRNVNA